VRRSTARQWREPTLCAHCRSTVPHWKRLCDSCWSLLPWPRRRAIIDARDAKAPHLVTARVLDAAEWLKQNSPAAQAARRMGERE
jgi:predicted amidophosphoribosyltransferase